MVVTLGFKSLVEQETPLTYSAFVLTGEFRMDLSEIQVILGLAANAVGLTKDAASTVIQMRQAVSGNELQGDTRKAEELLNILATDLTAANMANVQLSTHLKALSDALLRENALEKRKRRYKLVDMGEGVILFVLRAEDADEDPPHYICPICLEKERRFHFVTGPAGGDGKHCQGCGHYFQFRKPHYSVRSNRNPFA